MKNLKQIVALVLGAAVLSACTYSEAPDCEGLEVYDVWIRSAPPGTEAPQAGYFNAFNNGGGEIVVHRVESTDFERVEMHETVSAGGSSKMKALSEFRIKPRSGTEFAPGGKHLMLFGSRLDYAEGDRVQLEFVCGSERTHTPLNAEIRSSAPVGEKAATDR